MEGKYYHTKESVQEYIELAKDVDGRDQIEKLKRILPAGKTILEIGSGPGSDWKILNEIYDVTGSDNSRCFVEHLKNAYPQGDFIVLDAVSIEIELKYDAIYSNKVFQHLSDLELGHSIQKQSEVLNPNGIICHSFWKGKGSEIFKGLLVNYQSKSSINELFRDYFEILSIEEYNEFEDGDSLLLIGRRK